MRFNFKESNIRVCSGFLFFPKTIKGELRWLEKAKWKEEYCGMYVDGWIGVEWLNE